MTSGGSLSKSNFKLGYECPFKLRYFKAGYPSNRTDDPTAEFFAKGGFMVEALAHAVLTEDPRVEFERTISHGRYHARVDAFLESKDEILLIEIKSSSFDSSNPKEKISSKYLLDIAFQVMVARLAYPGRRITAQLCMVDPSKSSSIDSIFDKIEVLREDEDKSKPRAIYQGDVDQLRKDHFLAFIDVGELIEPLLDEVSQRAQDLIEFLDGERVDTRPELGISKCKNCEFRVKGQRPSGFDECWGGGGEGPLSIDLYRAGNDKGLSASITELWIDGRRSLVDIPEQILDGGKSYGPPRRNQRRVAASGGEFVDQALGLSLERLTYPIAFVDFETSTIPVPYFPGMKPYEVVAFQFSAHTVLGAGSTDLCHAEWINLDNAFPNREFLMQLRDRIGEVGTVVTWASHERTVLRQIKKQLIQLGDLDEDLASWLDGLTGGDDTAACGRIVDLSQACRAHYAHPAMNGSHSIKRVLDAIWSDADHLWSHPWFKEYVVNHDDGAPIDPYQALIRGNPHNLEFAPDDEDDALAVNHGVAAMEAYQALLFGERRNDAEYATRLKTSLLDYCKLDTAAMVMVWMHWRHRLGLVT